MTALGVGISGITPSSPALSVSSTNERLAVSAYEDERYSIYVWNAAEPFEPPAAQLVDVAALPPLDQSSPTVRLLSAAARPGAAADSGLSHGTLQREAVAHGRGTADCSAGVSSYGPMVAGSAGFTFGDALGDRMLATGLQVGKRTDQHVQLQGCRIRGGISAIGSPMAMASRQRTDSLRGRHIRERARHTRRRRSRAGQSQTIYREVERNSAAILMYPIDRARRFEVAGGFAQNSFEQIVNSTVYFRFDRESCCPRPRTRTTLVCVSISRRRPPRSCQTRRALAPRARFKDSGTAWR